jgi:hypothetical protein
MTRRRAPGHLLARHSSYAERRDGDAHADYSAMITRELGGRRAASYRAIDDGRPEGRTLLLRPLALFLFSCTAFVVVAIGWAWQAGHIAALLPDRGAAVAAPAPRWTAGGRERGVMPENPERFIDHDAPVPELKKEPATSDGDEESG